VVPWDDGGGESREVRTVGVSELKVRLWWAWWEIGQELTFPKICPCQPHYPVWRCAFH
jgi:hypothetical protein